MRDEKRHYYADYGKKYIEKSENVGPQNLRDALGLYVDVAVYFFLCDTRADFFCRQTRNICGKIIVHISLLQI